MITATKVHFKKFPEGDVIALFPDDHEGNGMIGSYQHIGQHSPASPELLTELQDATPEEYEPLLNELLRIGYKCLEIANTIRKTNEELGFK